MSQDQMNKPGETTDTNQKPTSPSQGFFSNAFTDFTSVANAFNQAARSAAEGVTPVLDRIGERGKTVVSTVTPVLGKIGEESKNVMSKVTEGLSDLFLDDDFKPSRNRSQFSDPSVSRTVFQLSESDTIKGLFICQLQQIYQPVGNDFSPIVHVNFPTTVCVTDKELCLVVEYLENDYLTKIPHEDVRNLLDEDNMLHVKIKEDQKLVFHGFEKLELKQEAFELLEDFIS